MISFNKLRLFFIGLVAGANLIPVGNAQSADLDDFIDQLSESSETIISVASERLRRHQSLLELERQRGSGLRARLSEMEQSSKGLERELRLNDLNIEKLDREMRRKASRLYNFLQVYRGASADMAIAIGQSASVFDQDRQYLPTGMARITAHLQAQDPVLPDQSQYVALAQSMIIEMQAQSELSLFSAAVWNPETEATEEIRLLRIGTFGLMSLDGRSAFRIVDLPQGGSRIEQMSVEPAAWMREGIVELVSETNQDQPVTLPVDIYRGRVPDLYTASRE